MSSFKNRIHNTYLEEIDEDISCPNNPIKPNFKTQGSQRCDHWEEASQDKIINYLGKNNFIFSFKMIFNP